MTERCIGMIMNISFNLIPISLVVPDLFARWICGK